MENQNLSDPGTILNLVNQRTDQERRTYFSVGPAAADDPLLSSDEVLGHVERNEVGDAQLFCRLFREKYVFDRNAGEWFCWDGHSWNKDRRGSVVEDLDAVVRIYEQESQRQAIQRMQAAREGRKENGDHDANEITRRVKALRSLKRRKNVLELAGAGIQSLGITGSEWDKRTAILPCRNGVIDLETGELHPGRQADFLRSAAPLEYPGLHVEAPAWEKALLEIFGGNQETVCYLQTVLGYAITGKVIEHIFVVFFGPEGRNGKSTIVNTLSYILGQDLAGVIPVETLLAQKYTQNPAGPRPDILSLRGRRLCFSSESGEGHRLSSEKVKLLSGGDILSARAPHAKEDVTFSPTHTLFFSSNHLPQISLTDKALWQRIHVFPFLQRFVDDPEKDNERPKDKYLPDKLKAEAPAILSWLVRGSLAWQRDGLQKPSAVATATGEYYKSMDLVSQFYEDECLLGASYKAKAKDLWERYEEWGKRQERYLGSGKFYERLKVDFDSHKDRFGKWYLGIGLTDTEQNSWGDDG